MYNLSFLSLNSLYGSSLMKLYLHSYSLGPLGLKVKDSSDLLLEGLLEMKS